MYDYQPSLSPRFIAYVRDFLLDLEINPSPFFKETGLSVVADDELGTTLSIGDVCQLFNVVSNKLERPYFGVELARGYHYEASSLIIVAFMAAPDVRSALQTLLRYDQYVDSAIETTLTHSGGLSCFEVNLLAPEGVNTEQLSEYLLFFLANSIKIATRKILPAARVSFTHQSSKSVEPLEAIFHAPVIFGAKHNSLFFETDFLDSPLHTKNQLIYDVNTRGLREIFTSAGEHFDFVQAVHRQVLLQLKTGNPTVGSVAEALQLSTRTLRRRLSDHGLKLQDVKNEARAQRAIFYLTQTQMPLSQVALEVGFSEMSAFSRAFRLWTKMSPQECRDLEANSKVIHLKVD